MSDADLQAGGRLLDGLHVCMLTSRHPPDDDRIYFKESWSLAAMGARVTVVCPDRKRPPEVPAAVDIRFHLFPHEPAIRGAARTMRALAGALRDLRPDVVHCHEPDALAVALFVGTPRRSRVVYDSHEMWGGVAAERLPRAAPGLTQGCFQAAERVLVRRCGGGVGASSAISEYLGQALASERVETIFNVPRPEAFRQADRRQPRDFFLFVHEGHLTFDRGLMPLVEAVSQLAQRLPVRLRIVGDVFGAERQWLDEYLHSRSCEDVVERTGWLPYVEVGAAIAQCDVGVIAFEPTPNHLIAAPNKLFNYMLCGLPVLGPDFPRSDIARVVRAEGCGRLVPQISSAALTLAMEQFVTDREATGQMGRNGLEASRRAYRWEHMEPRLSRLYQRVLEG